MGVAVRFCKDCRYIEWPVTAESYCMNMRAYQDVPPDLVTGEVRRSVHLRALAMRVEGRRNCGSDAVFFRPLDVSSQD